MAEEHKDFVYAEFEKTLSDIYPDHNEHEIFDDIKLLYEHLNYIFSYAHLKQKFKQIFNSANLIEEGLEPETTRKEEYLDLFMLLADEYNLKPSLALNISSSLLDDIDGYEDLKQYIKIVLVPTSDRIDILRQKDQYKSLRRQTVLGLSATPLESSSLHNISSNSLFEPRLFPLIFSHIYPVIKFFDKTKVTLDYTTSYVDSIDIKYDDKDKDDIDTWKEFLESYRGYRGYRHKYKINVTISNVPYILVIITNQDNILSILLLDDTYTYKSLFIRKSMYGIEIFYSGDDYYKNMLRLIEKDVEEYINNIV